MAAKKTRKREYIPPANEVVNRRERTPARKAERVQRSQPARGAGRQASAYPQPSLRRTLRRLPIYFVLILALQYFLAPENARDLPTGERLMLAASSAAFVTVLFAPFMHVMDRFAYNRYLKRTGQQPAAAKPAKD